MNIVIIEDDENKREQIRDFLTSLDPDGSHAYCLSYNSGIKSILESANLDLVILDMTMPTYDICVDDDGGRPQHYAGRAILRQMKRRSVNIPTIVLTQFEVFGEGIEQLTREELDKQLSNETFGIYVGMAYYNAAVDGWKDELRKLINKGINQA